MSPKRWLAAALIMAAALVVTALAAGGGTAADPLISLSYLEQIFTRKVETRLAEATGQLAALADRGVTDSLTAALEAQLNAAVADRVAARVAQRVTAQSSLSIGSMSRLTLSQGDRVVGQPGTGFVLQSGTAQLCGSQSAQILDLTAGAARSPGLAAATGSYYMVTANDGSGLQVTSATAQVLVRDGATVLKAYTPLNTATADALREAGLFVGTTSGYELDRPPTRQEALIMLIRMLGEETAALGHTGTTTFKDLTGWADGQKYIIYAHNKGYTNGESATAFAQYKYATLEMYLTFTLRALGFSDTAGDFIWDSTSRDMAVRLGLLTQAQLDGIGQSGFMRDHVVLICGNALNVPLKNSAQTLGDKLVAAGALSQSQMDALRAQQRR